MENISEASPSVDSSSTGSSSLACPSIQMVSKSDSERLLGKYFDASQYGFDYEQSSLWSPLIPARRVFLASPAGHRCYEDEFFSKLKKAKRATPFGALQDDNLNWCHPRLNFFSKGMFYLKSPFPSCTGKLLSKRFDSQMNPKYLCLATIHAHKPMYFYETYGSMKPCAIYFLVLKLQHIYDTILIYQPSQKGFQVQTEPLKYMVLYNVSIQF
ncbi:hypothetical protein NC651_027167 [Populus alba x Populus x berolinensis]|nr:hypothetical protein NC651_027167 [Populus alba x Populus x berolinensis]